MRFPFQTAAPERELRQPQPARLPRLEGFSVAAMYRAPRMGGDFYDFVTSDSGLLAFLLLDVAGKRDEALDIAAAVQDRFRSLASERFRESGVNESEAVTELAIALNRTVMDSAGGVRCAPAFLGCYNEGLGTVVYINAGHTPALVVDEDGVTALEAGGLPLGLFYHATHDAQFRVLRPGAALVAVSRGLMETKAGAEEFGVERLKRAVQCARFSNAQELCSAVLEAVNAFLESKRRRRDDNDTTALVLLRAAAAKAARA